MNKNKTLNYIIWWNLVGLMYKRSKQNSIEDNYVVSLRFSAGIVDKKTYRIWDIRLIHFHTVPFSLLYRYFRKSDST